MKTIVLPDLHGESLWSDILIKESFDQVVLLGDYLDNSKGINGKQELINLRNIIKLKESYPEQVFLLLGNHEYHYTKAAMKLGERSPRYQADLAGQFREVLEEYGQLFQMAYKYEEYLFSHSGVTCSWLNKYSGSWQVSSIDKAVNEIWSENPEAFRLTKEGLENGWGDDIYQSPIWVRPYSLKSDAKPIETEIIQVVGHTPQEKLEVMESGNQRYYFTDTFKSSREYLVIDNGIVSIGRF
ncbi:MAG: metallophosphoesterase [Candidatus Dadabacteria bacterium]